MLSHVYRKYSCFYTAIRYSCLVSVYHTRLNSNLNAKFESYNMAYQFSFNPCICLYFDKFICIKWHYIESSFQHNKQFIASESEDLQHDLVLFLYFDSNLLTKNNLVPNYQSELCLKRSCSSAMRQVVNVYSNQLYLCAESEYKLNQLQGNHITKILSKIFFHIKV